MLSAPDQDVAKRDPALPGLRIILDNSAMQAALRSRLPDLGLADVRCGYIRYKPGTNCLAEYRARVAGQDVRFYATAYGSGCDDRLRELALRSDAEPPGLSALRWPNTLVLAPEAISVHRFPFDRKISALHHLASPDARSTLLKRVLSNGDWAETCDPSALALQMLAYKPERRFVAALTDGDVPRAVLKMHSVAGFERACRNARLGYHGPRRMVRLPRRLGRSRRYCAVVMEWLPGRLLNQVAGSEDFDPAEGERVGAALAKFHRSKAEQLPAPGLTPHLMAVDQAAEAVRQVAPSLLETVQRVAAVTKRRLADQPEESAVIHGDFYAKQVVLQEETVAFIDLDEAARGSTAADLGNFMAHLEWDVIRGRLSRERADALRDALLCGYAASCRDRFPPSEVLAVHLSAGLIRLAPHPFRNREPEWPQQIERLLDRAEAACREEQRIPGWTRMNTNNEQLKKQFVQIRVNSWMSSSALDDPVLGTLVETAIDPQRMGHILRERLRSDVEVNSARITRHKPGRRCLIEYDLRLGGADSDLFITAVGKIRRNGADEHTCRLHQFLRRHGFGDNSSSGVSVPEPIALVPECGMWLQRKMEGVPVEWLLSRTDGPALCQRIATAGAQLHRTAAPVRREHTMSDELAILRERLNLLSQRRPEWARRLHRVLESCERLAAEAAVSDMDRCGIHRDFYPEQVLIDDERLWLLDLDLYCRGDPALDIGNFIGHITELSLRLYGTADPLSDCEAAMVEQYVRSARGVTVRAIAVYRALTLARHISISQQMSERMASTERLLSWWEDEFIL